MTEDVEARRRLENADRTKYELAAAYEAVFGKEGHRNIHQEKVWRDLMRQCGWGKPVFQFDQQGHFCPLRASFRDGQHSVIAMFMEQLELSESGPQSISTPVAKTTRDKQP